MQFGAHEGIKFHAVVEGECWVCVDGTAEPVRIRAGECFLLARGRPIAPLLWDITPRGVNDASGANASERQRARRGRVGLPSAVRALSLASGPPTSLRPAFDTFPS